jgi:hypothetical protein
MITRSRRQSIALATVLVLALGAGGSAAAAPASQPSVPVSGTAAGATLSGLFTLTSFAVQNGQVVAQGTLSGILTTATGASTSVLTNVAMPVSVTQATCDILHLDIGPIALDLLGLKVDLSRIVLDITAQTGAGNLLGNLLCAVTGLLDNPSGLSRLLNQILAAL